MKRKPGTPLGRFALGYRLDHNPLRRASDRMETVVLALLALTFLIAAPFVGLGTGAWAKGIAYRVQLSQQASYRQVPAVTLKAASGPLGDGGYAPSDSNAPARWMAPDGKVVTGQIPVEPGTMAGVTVRVWVTRDGRLTDRPLQDSQVRAQAVFAGVLSVIAFGVVLSGIGALARRTLNKRRMAAWDTDWRATGPRWTTRA